MINLPPNFDPVAFTNEIYSYVAILVSILFLVSVSGLVIRILRRLAV